MPSRSPLAPGRIPVGLPFLLGLPQYEVEIILSVLRSDGVVEGGASGSIISPSEVSS